MGWYRLADAGGSYTLQGAVVGSEGIATGIVVRPDRQSEEDILAFLNNLGGHAEDAARQRKQIPEWAINRGGKVAVEFKPGPGGGFTAGDTAILVAEWITTEHTALLLHPKVSGIIAGKGGKTSHAVVVARARSIPIIVDVDEEARIQPGDHLWFDASTGIIKVNGGDATEFEGVREADEPIYGFVWSNGQGAYDSITPGSEGQVAIHMELAQKGMQEGWFNPADTGMGVIYQDGKVQLYQYPSDQERMVEWLNTIHPITEIK